jgi:hypothetical protein
LYDGGHYRATDGWVVIQEGQGREWTSPERGAERGRMSRLKEMQGSLYVCSTASGCHTWRNTSQAILTPHRPWTTDPVSWVRCHFVFDPRTHKQIIQGIIRSHQNRLAKLLATVSLSFKQIREHFTFDASTLFWWFVFPTSPPTPVFILTEIFSSAALATARVHTYI